MYICVCVSVLTKVTVAFQVYDIDGDGFISNGELFQVLKMMVGSNLNDIQLQQIVDKTILEGDQDKDGRISFDEFKRVCTDGPLIISPPILICSNVFVLAADD